MNKKSDNRRARTSRVPSPLTGELSGPALLQSALDDLRAAAHLRSQLERSDRSVLKLLDDAAELLMKATLTGNGIAWGQKPFPWLLKQCGPFVDVPEDLHSIHALRNRVKHAGASASGDVVAKAYRVILELLQRLPGSAGATYGYCVLCHMKVPLFRPTERETARGTKIAEGWCFVHDGVMVARMGGLSHGAPDRASDSTSLDDAEFGSGI